MIRWPEHYDPKQAPVHVRNELVIAAPPELVWAWLVRAEAWPSWYPNSANVRIAGGGAELVLRTRFRWRAFGDRQSVQPDSAPTEDPCTAGTYAA